MLEFRHILFPTDFSDNSKAFRPLVQFVARRFRAKLTLLHVVPVLSGADYGDMTGVFATVGDIDAVEERMSGLLSEFFRDSDLERIPEFDRQISLGDPAVVIADFAKNHAADLIMMPTHGYGRFRSLLMGSVASKVLHDAECPVWTAAHGENLEPMRHSSVKHIIGALDLVDADLDLLHAAAGLANKFGAVLKLVHAVPAAEHVPGDTGGEEFGRFLLHAAKEHLEKLQTQAGTSFEVQVEPGDVPRVLRQAAVDSQADLIVLGRGVVHAPFGRLRSKTYEIIREAPCPVLSL